MRCECCARKRVDAHCVRASNLEVNPHAGLGSYGVVSPAEGGECVSRPVIVENNSLRRSCA